MNELRVSTIGPSPSPGADVAGVGPVPVQMWLGWAQSQCRCGRGEPSPGADVCGIRGTECAVALHAVDKVARERASGRARVDTESVRCLAHAALGEARRSRPTEQADGAGRRSRPTEQADGAGRRSRPTEQADGAGRRSRPHHALVELAAEGVALGASEPSHDALAVDALHGDGRTPCRAHIYISIYDI